LPCCRHGRAQFVTRAFTITGSFDPVWDVDLMPRYRRFGLPVQFIALALLMSALPAEADTFQQIWMGRVARPPADNEAASVYWEDRWDARGKRFKPNEVSCAHRTEALGTVFVVTNLDNGKMIDCPVTDRGPFAQGRVLDFSLGAAHKIGCDGLCRISIRRAGYE
jgi:rare lipoprotein A